MIEIEESGLIFELADDNCFRVEQHRLVTRGCRNCTQNNKACEFITYLNNRHVFVEVKQSAPQKVDASRKPNLPHNWVVYDNYETYLRTISKKFADSFYILTSLADGNHGKCQEPLIENTRINLHHIEFILILNPSNTLTSAEKDGIAVLRDSLVNEMRPFLNIWNISPDSVKILLPYQAHNKYGFIKSGIA